MIQFNFASEKYDSIQLVSISISSSESKSYRSQLNARVYFGTNYSALSVWSFDKETPLDLYCLLFRSFYMLI
jgi:hypothetical protein